MPFDGAATFGKLAAIFLIGWLAALPFIGWGPGLLTLAGILFVLYHLLAYCNQLEQRDLDESMEGSDDGDDDA
jgi:hypothetical protein